MQETISLLQSFVTNPGTVAIIVGLYLAIRFLKMVPGLGTNEIFLRVLPLIPEIVIIPLAATGMIPVLSGQPIMMRLIGGVWIAYAAIKMQKVIGQTILGDDAKIAAAKAEKASLQA